MITFLKIVLAALLLLLAVKLLPLTLGLGLVASALAGLALLAGLGVAGVVLVAVVALVAALAPLWVPVALAALLWLLVKKIRAA